MYKKERTKKKKFVQIFSFIIPGLVVAVDVFSKSERKAQNKTKQKKNRTLKNTM